MGLIDKIQGSLKEGVDRVTSSVNDALAERSPQALEARTKFMEDRIKDTQYYSKEFRDAMEAVEMGDLGIGCYKKMRAPNSGPNGEYYELDHRNKFNYPLNREVEGKQVYIDSGGFILNNGVHFFKITGNATMLDGSGCLVGRVVLPIPEQNPLFVFNPMVGTTASIDKEGIHNLLLANEMTGREPHFDSEAVFLEYKSQSQKRKSDLIKQKITGENQ